MPKRRNDPASVAFRSAITALKASEAMGAAASVIAARTELTTLALSAPTAEAGAEIGLMVTEKVSAFSEAGAAVAGGAGELASRGVRYAAEEAVHASRGMAQLAACRTPFDLMQVQTRLATEFWGRSVSYGMGLGALAAKTSERALHPVHKTVVANHKRLNGK